MNFSVREDDIHAALRKAASSDIGAIMRDLGASPEGLSEAEAALRLKRFGPNRVAQDAGAGALRELARHVFNPLNGLLLTLAVASWILSDRRAAIVISAMVILSVLLAYVQEHRSNAAAAKLRAMVRTHASVRRPGAGDDPFVEISLDALVPGDVIRLTAGDMVPADMRLITTKDLFVNQSALTGESMPIEKFGRPVGRIDDPVEAESLAFMGSNVVSGYGEALVLATGRRTVFGAIADKITEADDSTAFDESVRKFTWLMIGFMAAMAPLVFFINGYFKATGSAPFFSPSPSPSA